MTLAWFLGGLTLGSVITGTAVLRWHWHRIETLGYLRDEAEAFRARTVCGDLDHYYRLAIRLQAELDDLRRRTLVYVGDLLDKVAARDRTITQLNRVVARLTAPRHRRPSPIPPYGNQQAAS